MTGNGISEIIISINHNRCIHFRCWTKMVLNIFMSNYCPITAIRSASGGCARVLISRGLNRPIRKRKSRNKAVLQIGSVKLEITKKRYLRSAKYYSFPLRPILSLRFLSRCILTLSRCLSFPTGICNNRTHYFFSEIFETLSNTSHHQREAKIHVRTRHR